MHLKKTLDKFTNREINQGKSSKMAPKQVLKELKTECKWLKRDLKLTLNWNVGIILKCLKNKKHEPRRFAESLYFLCYKNAYEISKNGPKINFCKSKSNHKVSIQKDVSK